MIILRRGDVLPTVTVLQCYLNEQPSTQEFLEVDGIFGPRTEAAVARFRATAVSLATLPGRQRGIGMASLSEANSVSLRHLCLSRPLKLSMKAFCCGFCDEFQHYGGAESERRFGSRA